MRTGIKKDGTIVVFHNKKVEYYSNLIRVLEIVYPHSKEKLSDTEIKFLALCLEMDGQGMNIGSTPCRKILEEELKLTKQSVYNMRSDLRSRGWIKHTDLGYSFSGLLTKKEVSFTIKLEEDEH